MKSTERKNNKTVYILGAGFSYPARIPLQMEILNGIERLEIMDLPRVASEVLMEDQSRWTPFYKRLFPLNQVPTLEDVFTLLDQTISQRGFCGKYTYKELDIIRSALKRLILVLFQRSEEETSVHSRNFYNLFLGNILEQCVENNFEQSSPSIISLNWDCLVEKSLAWCIDKINKEKCITIDYCCETNELVEEKQSGYSKVHKPLSIQIMKMHGSVNWFLCPNCNRLYTVISAKSTDLSLYVNPRPCPGCKIFLSNELDEIIPEVEPFLITPTFLKVFDNPHINMTWHNAYLNLLQARKIIFIGYSFPDADYHFRTLLRRSVNRNAKIVVVLSQNDKPEKKTSSNMLRFFAKTRYQEFFGSDRVEFEFDGVEAFFRKAFKASSSQNLIRRIKRKYNRLK